jgi:hypothetical protein
VVSKARRGAVRTLTLSEGQVEALYMAVSFVLAELDQPDDPDRLEVLGLPEQQANLRELLRLVREAK